ncbi:MAG: TlpA disulfide reductase family protein [Planctomycetota bacterium]
MTTLEMMFSSAPETLLGKAAPEFRVELLDGNTMELSKLLDGRPALITFWGLACGPCRQEAPWLTRYHKQYVDRGFLILAVNAYDDSRDDVQQYVDSKKLEHAISLGGSDIADVYQVSAYPTSFWINRSGEVIDYDIGFSNPDRIERKLLQLIGESPSL